MDPKLRETLEALEDDAYLRNELDDNFFAALNAEDDEFYEEEEEEERISNMMKKKLKSGNWNLKNLEKIKIE